MADGYGYGEKRVAWEEMRKRKKKRKRKKRDGLKDETGHSKWGHHVNIFTEMPLKTEL